MSHELRTPLTSVVGLTKLVRKRFDDIVLPAIAASPAAADPKVERAVGQIGQNLGIMAAEGDRLTAMINDVLDLQKIEAGRMEFRREPVDVVAVIDQACAAVAPLFDAGGLELVREVPTSLPEIVGDHHRLIQVAINLLSNAAKFTAHGSITIRAAVATAPAGGDEVVDQRRRHRRRHPGGGSRARVRGVRPERRHADRQAARHRPRPADIPRDRRRARRADAGSRARSATARRSGSHCRSADDRRQRRASEQGRPVDTSPDQPVAWRHRRVRARQSGDPFSRT